MLQPSDLGAPSHLASWRPQQGEIFERLYNGTGTRFDVTALPTGVGKSLLAWGYAKAIDARTVILTKTLALQEQYLRDFGAAGLTDVRGMGNYPCLILPGGSCAEGPCLDGESCDLKAAGCLYFDALRRAVEAPLVITSYAFWLAHPEGLGPRDMLVLDEAHSIQDEVSKAAGAHFTARETRLVEEMDGRSLGEWKEWALNQAHLTQALLEEGRTTAGERRELRTLLDRFWRLARASEEEWDFDFLAGRFLRAEPIVPAAYAEQLLFRKIPKVLLLSATIRPSDLLDLGVPAEETTFMEADSPFPVERRPVYIVESGVRMSHKASSADLRQWVATIDRVIEQRKGLKGIIHTVSYSRAKMLKELSGYRELMMIHPPDELRGTVETFKRMRSPGILVSPSVHTGFDFPYEEAGWQIVSKIPYPDTRNGLARARSARDELYIQKHAARTLIQMIGRIVRADDDYGETFIVDDSINWLYGRYRPYFSQWIRKALIIVPKGKPIPPRKDFTRR